MFRILFVLLAILLPMKGNGQTRFRIVEYNVENLFDTQHDTLKNDYEFLPSSTRNWNEKRYWKKQKNLAKVIMAIGGEKPADLVALCEVENHRTLTDLTRRSILRRAGYQYIMTSSPDDRGIDVALLYQPSTFKPISYQCINVHPEIIEKKNTRDILLVTGMVYTGDTLDVMVCHMPSRSGGKKRSEPFRLHTAKYLRNTVDSLMNIRNNPRIIITGDFNDEPTDKALLEVLRAGKESVDIDAKELYNLMYDVKPGTYRYKGEWNTLDQMIVNGLLLPAKAQIFMPNYLLEDEPKFGGKKPKRNYVGMRYNNGFSDHLPIYTDLFIRDDRENR